MFSRKLHLKPTILLSALLVFVLVLSACGGGTTQEPTVVTEADVIQADETTTVTEEAPVAVETPAVETPAVETPEVEDTEVVTETEAVTDTGATGTVTETETTQPGATGTVTGTQDVQGTGVQTPTVGMDATEPISLTLATDAAGNRFLADQDGQPIFAYTGTEAEFVANENFEPIHAENVTMGEGLDETMFGQVEQDGVNQLTYNDMPLFRFVGTGDAMTLAAEGQFLPLSVEN